MKEFILLTDPYNSSSVNALKVGTWNQELAQRPRRSAVYCLAPMVCPTCFLIKPKIISPQIQTPRRGWALPHQSVIKEVPNRVD